MATNRTLYHYECKLTTIVNHQHGKGHQFVAQTIRFYHQLVEIVTSTCCSTEILCVATTEARFLINPEGYIGP